MAQNINTLNMSRNEWLEERRKGIGGSDAAAIMGLNPWRTPYAVWADKTGQLPEKEDTESMRQGRDLEDYVAHRFMESTGKRFAAEIRSSKMISIHLHLPMWTEWSQGKMPAWNAKQHLFLI